MVDYTTLPLADDVEASNAQAIQSTFAPKVTYNPLVETVRAVGQGATFGTLDEIEAALRTGSISNDEYVKLRDQLRGQQRQFGEDFPAVKTPVELAGGFALPFGVLRQVQKAAPETQALITGTTTMGQVGRTAAVGTGTGALAGYGYAEGDAGSEAAMGGIFGGVLGGTVPIVINKAGSIIKNVLNSAGIGDQATASSKMLASYMEKDNLTPQEAQQALDELRRIGVPNPVIADLGANLKSLGYNAYIVQSKAKGSTEKFLEGRLIDQPNDIVKGLVEKAGLAKDVNGFEYLNALAESQSLKASQAYPNAYRMDIDARPFREYIDRDVFKNAYKNAVRSADTKGIKLPSLDAIRNAQSVPTDILHKIKMGLDTVIEGETDAVTGKVSSYGRDVVNVKNEFNDKIKALNNDYKLANAEFADASRIRNSFEMGQKYQTLDPKQAASNIKKMNNDEKEAFRLGMMADINARLGKYKGGDFTREIFKSNNQKLLIRNAFTDTVDADGKVIKSAQDAYTDFSQYIKGLEQQSKTAKKIIGGSPSGERIASTDQAREMAGMAQSAASGDVFGLMRAAGSSLLARAKGISSESSEILQRKLFSADPIEQRAILAELNRRARTPKTGLLSGAAGVGTATGILGD
jgi:hypothetical protein